MNEHESIIPLPSYWDIWPPEDIHTSIWAGDRWLTIAIDEMVGMYCTTLTIVKRGDGHKID